MGENAGKGGPLLSPILTAPGPVFHQRGHRLPGMAIAPLYTSPRSNVLEVQAAEPGEPFEGEDRKLIPWFLRRRPFFPLHI